MPQDQDITVRIEGGPELHFPLGTKREVIDRVVRAHTGKLDFSGATSIGTPPSTASLARATGISKPPSLFRRAQLWGVGALPAVGMTIGGIAGTAGGPAAAITGAGLGGAAGESARQLASRAMGLPDVPQTSSEAALGVAREAAIGAGTEATARLGAGLLGKAAKAVAPIKLPSGETVHVTPGVKAGAPGPLEHIAEQMMMGKPLRTARKAEQAELQSIMQNIAQRAAQRGGATIGRAEETWRAFGNSGRALLDTANPIYEGIKQGMRDPAAATPPMSAMVDFARTEYIKNQTLRRIIDAARSGADPAADIAPAQLRDDITKLAGLQPLVKLGVKPEQAVRGFTDAFGGGEVSVFDIFQRMRSNLLEMSRSGRLSPSDARIASGLARKLTESMETGLRESGGQKAVGALRHADALWSQGRSLEDLGEQLSSATSGIEPSAQAAATRPVEQTFKAGTLSKQLKESRIEPYYRGKSLLERAITDPIDRQTYTQTVDLLVRSLRAGGPSGFAARWHALGLMAEVGAIATAGTVGGLGGWAITPEVGAYIVSKALTSKSGAKMLQAYLRHPEGTKQALAAGQRLAAWALESSTRESELKE